MNQVQGIALTYFERITDVNYDGDCAAILNINLECLGSRKGQWLFGIMAHSESATGG